MYLQMYWLITSGGDIIRCEYCGGVISLTRPRPEGRKTRRDKKFLPVQNPVTRTIKLPRSGGHPTELDHLEQGQRATRLAPTHSGW